MTLARLTTRRYNVGTRSPHSRLSGSHPSASARPNGFAEWWAYGVDQASAVMRMGRGGWWRGLPGAAFAPTLERFQIVRHHVPRGWRFAGDKNVEEKPRRRKAVAPEAVSSVTDAITSKSPMTSVMQSLMNPRGSHPHEYRILFALVSGHTDAEVVRAVIGGCREDFFRNATIRALSMVYERAQEDITKK